MIAQYITYLSILKIKPCFIVNKTDFSLPPSTVCERLTYVQKELNIPVFYGSAKQGTLIYELKMFLMQKRAIFVGPSGVGKSSLIQRLFPQETLQVGALSDADKGCHTTSVTQLYELSNGTSVIDAPGVRQCDLGVITKEELKIGFPDFLKVQLNYHD